MYSSFQYEMNFEALLAKDERNMKKRQEKEENDKEK